MGWNAALPAVTSGHHRWPGAIVAPLRGFSLGSTRHQGFRCAPPLAIRFAPLRGRLFAGFAAVCLQVSRPFVCRFRGGLLDGFVAFCRTIAWWFVGRFRIAMTAAERQDVSSRGWSAAQPPVMRRRCDLSRASGGTLPRGLPCRIPAPHCCFTSFTGKDSPGTHPSRSDGWIRHHPRVRRVEPRATRESMPTFAERRRDDGERISANVGMAPRGAIVWWARPTLRLAVADDVLA
jgi:hypothetical protein